MYKRISALLIVVMLLGVAVCATAAQDSVYLKKVKAAEAGFRDIKADMVVTNPNKDNVQGMGEGYGDILQLQKATLSFKSPDKLRFDGYAKGVKVVYLQNGYTKLITAAMIRHKKMVKNEPGQRQDTLDIGFLSSRLWTDNTVSVVSNQAGVVQLKFKPKFGSKDKRCDLVWINGNNLRVIKREKYLADGTMRARYMYSDYMAVGKSLPLARKVAMFDAKGGGLGTISYVNVKINSGLAESLFSLNQK